MPDARRPFIAQVVVLYVEQEESVRRQLNRAQLAAKHNTRVLDAGAGDLWELRPTDIDSAKCRRRYDVFKVCAHAASSAQACLNVLHIFSSDIYCTKCQLCSKLL